MKKNVLITLTLAMTLLLSAPAAFCQDKAKEPKKPSAESLALAAEYYQASEFKGMLEKSLTPMLNQFPEKNRKELRTALDKILADDGPMKKQIINAAASSFTEAELKAMVSYYTSAEGKSILKKMPNYTRETGQIIQSLLMPVVQQQAMKLRMQMQEEQKKAAEAAKAAAAAKKAKDAKADKKEKAPAKK
ncbi:DUF2059 domain-containing protein [Dethiosulfatarculus sandiegensis]|uniref:DUF2059 domain-containing protein n=1 Tax=Dethiosulfatarculus sandiegensis TaxID=1429043 RepID=A0A0D2HLV2_9BACT|nr:DUF2059 domain-containing protein [Dethiosulfatarculus sandiegensis]KIX11543.1 hypothetical protein X474_24035 [Dethiosulfatarculus sandiegensis]